MEKDIKRWKINRKLKTANASKNKCIHLKYLSDSRFYNVQYKGINVLIKICFTIYCRNNFFA